MSTDTHINVIREEYAKAIQAAHGAIDTAVEKFEQYIAKLEADLGGTPASTPPEVAPTSPVPATSKTEVKSG